MSQSKTYSPSHGGYPGTIEDQQESKDRCVCDHCREAGTCFGCTGGVCP